VLRGVLEWLSCGETAKRKEDKGKARAAAEEDIKERLGWVPGWSEGAVWQPPLQGCGSWEVLVEGGEYGGVVTVSTVFKAGVLGSGLNGVVSSMVDGRCR
jgi:hypothetical protein